MFAMKFTFVLQTVSTIFIIALIGITNSKDVSTHFPNPALNSKSGFNHELMNSEPLKRTRRKSMDSCRPLATPAYSYWREFPGYESGDFSVLELSCNDGYSMHFGGDIFCNGEGKWSHEPHCVANNIENVKPPYSPKISLKFCSSPSNRDNGHWRYRNSATLKCPRGKYCPIPTLLLFWGYGAHLHQICDSGYENRAIFHCNRNIGRWVSQPTCLAISDETVIPERRPQMQLRCKIPSQPRNGLYLLEKSQCQNGQHCNIPEGITELDAGAHLMISCNDGYKVNGIADVFCGADGKLSNDPECIEISCKALSTESTVAECSYNNEWISCESPVPLGTTANVSCRENYYPVVTGIPTEFERVTCVGNGEWNQKPLKCSPGPITINIYLNGTLESSQNVSRESFSVSELMDTIRNVSVADNVDPVPTTGYPAIDPRMGGQGNES